jgi:hypothetical protein
VPPLPPSPSPPEDEHALSVADDTISPATITTVADLRVRLAKFSCDPALP